MVRQWQELFFEERYSFTDIQNPNFIKIAEGYDIASTKIEDRDNLDRELQKMLDSKGAYLLEVVVGKRENVFPMMETGAAVNEIRLN
jgi:acetolactate synthase-1/2/3 large subunit